MATSSIFLKSVLQSWAQYVTGEEAFFELALISLISSGHLLLVWPPGVAKTRSARVFAGLSGLDFARVQFTADLLPSDVVGAEVYNPKTQNFVRRNGPVFTQILLADEINRAPAKVQSALLEAMQEGQVTITGVALPLPEYFTVMATMNPYDGVGTYTLPLATYDRFAYSYEFEYPSIAKEAAILMQQVFSDYPKESIIKFSDIASLREKLATIHVHEKIPLYVAALLASVRSHESFTNGVSVRAGLALVAGARARALLHGRDFVLPEDVETLWISTLAHRLELSYDAESEGNTISQILSEILEQTQTPNVQA